MTAVRDLLIAGANTSGGWGYRAGGASRLEPTCWALLALGTGEPAGFDPEPHWRFVSACQQATGLLVEDPALPPNFGFNGLAALALLSDARRRSSHALGTLLDALVAHGGIRVGPSPNFRQDNSLRGWPWIDGTFSWVEPTCWVTLALKRARASGHAPHDTDARIDEAERMLVDRCCRDGGWNYGNSNALGKELYPYISTTALALLALQDRGNQAAVSRSLAYLERGWNAERSTVGLALVSMCLRRYSRPADLVDAALAVQHQVAIEMGNLLALAVAVTATANAGHDTPFTV